MGTHEPLSLSIPPTPGVIPPHLLPLHEGVHGAALQRDEALSILHPDVQLARGWQPPTCG